MEKRTAISNKVRNSVFSRDGYLCSYCGSAGMFLDHIAPIYVGGSNDADNLRTTCQPCNSTKGKRSVEWLRLHRSVQASKYAGVITATQYLELKALGVVFDNLPTHLFAFEKVRVAA